MGMRLTLVAIDPDQFGRLESDPSILVNLLLHPPGDASLRMDKEWHGIHFLLTGDAYPTGSEYDSVVFGGSEFGPEVSYGPARWLTPQQINEIAALLQMLSSDDLRARYKPETMSAAQIYPDVWTRDGDEALEWLLKGYVKLREFYAHAAAHGRAVVLAIL